MRNFVFFSVILSIKLTIFKGICMRGIDTNFVSHAQSHRSYKIKVSIVGHGNVYRFASLKIRMTGARKVGEVF